MPSAGNGAPEQESPRLPLTEIAGVLLDGTGVTANTWQSPAHRLAEENDTGRLTDAEWSDVLATLPENPETADGWELSLVRRTVERILRDRVATRPIPPGGGP